MQKSIAQDSSFACQHKKEQMSILKPKIDILYIFTETKTILNLECCSVNRDVGLVWLTFILKDAKLMSLLMKYSYTINGFLRYCLIYFIYAM